MTTDAARAAALESIAAELPKLTEAVYTLCTLIAASTVANKTYADAAEHVLGIRDHIQMLEATRGE